MIIKDIIIKDILTSKKLPQFVLFVLLVFIFPACQKVINIDLNEAAPHIVIEGLITDGDGPYTVKISKSGSYFNQPELPPVSGAQVIISDDEGTVDTLKEITAGIYMTSLMRGIPGRTYTLKVSAENKDYTGSSTMHSHVAIDSLRLIKDDSQRFGFRTDTREEMHKEIHCYFKDPEEKNFYRIKVITNDSTEASHYRLYDDQYTNGQETDLRVAHPKSGDITTILLYSLDGGTFEYYRTLEDIIDSNPIFGSTPANPNTNLSNGALGYFGAGAVSSKTIVITDSLLNSVK